MEKFPNHNITVEVARTNQISGSQEYQLRKFMDHSRRDPDKPPTPKMPIKPKAFIRYLNEQKIGYYTYYTYGHASYSCDVKQKSTKKQPRTTVT